MMTSSKWKINCIRLVESCLSYNISKTGRKLITGKLDNDGHYDVINGNFDACARARCDVHGNVDCYYVRQCPEVHVYRIWSIYDEWLCRYEWWSEITKWRLDDVMVGWSGWKGYYIHSSSGQRYCENFKMIADSVLEISSAQNSWDLTFDLHLHSQDGLMSTWCYYVIWLADHITYAYKIWARFDQ